MPERGRILRAAEIAALRAADTVLARAEAVLADARIEADRLTTAALDTARIAAAADRAAHAAVLLAEAAALAEANARRLEPDLAAIVAAAIAGIVGAGDRDAMVRAALSTALSRLRDHRRARLYAAADVAEAARHAVAGTPGGAEVLEVVEDAALAPGHCTLSGPAGHVEIGLDAQLAATLAPWRRTADATCAAVA